MTYSIQYFLILITVVSLNACSHNTISYVDTNHPNNIPEIFAASIIQNKYGFVQSMDISTDKKEYFFQLTNPNWSFDKIICLTVQGHDHYSLDTIIDSKETNPFKHCGEPCISKNGNELFFSTLDDIWKLKRENGTWSDPLKLGAPVNTEWKEGHPSISNTGTLYFHSFKDDPLKNSIFFFNPGDEKNMTKTKIDILSEEGDAGDPAIAPDESFIVFASSRKSGYGNTDLYISYNVNGEWTKPENLGDKINTPDWELGPKISPDSKYLFFYRRDNWKNASYSKVYWVSMEGISKKDY